MTLERALTLLAIAWFAVIVLYLMGIGVIHVEASTDPGGEDVAMVCGKWTYYGDGVMQRVRHARELAPCSECVGMAATVNQAHLGKRIEI